VSVRIRWRAFDALSMRHILQAVSATAVLLACATAAAAQEPAASPNSPLAVGYRVRVHSTTAPGRIAGAIAAVDDEFLTVVPDGSFPAKIPRASITAIDASRGRKRNWLKGLGFGVALGVGVGFAFEVDSANCGPETVYFCSRGEALGTSTFLFGAIGAVAGAFITSERWTTIDLPGKR
jgi:hypothetical protein